MSQRVSSRILKQLACLAIEKTKQRRLREAPQHSDEELGDGLAFEYHERTGEWPPHFDHPLPPPRPVRYGDQVVYEAEPTQSLLASYWIKRLRAHGFPVSDDRMA